MVPINREGILLHKTNNEFENEGVLNPAVIEVEGSIHMFYRAVAKGNFSTIGYARFSNPTTLVYRRDHALLIPHYDYEHRGIEDPRIVHLDETFYLSYTAYDGLNALGAYAVSNDLETFEKKGLMVPQFGFREFANLAGSKSALSEKYLRFNNHEGIKEHQGKKMLVWDKNVIFFPRRIHGKILFLHRIKPEIQLVSVNSMTDLTDEFWQNYMLHFSESIVLSPKFAHEVSYIGGGCPPIETAAGWLLIYHSVYDTIEGYVYCASAALLDLENPLIEISRLPYPLFKPTKDWEKDGYVNNVCFPTGTVLQEDTLYVYYGAADESIACISLSISTLLNKLLSYAKPSLS
jgi:predicted GH43/DUF377 family glycosyl hydrolase